ncbi:DUF4079 family protein [Coleofasciculus sp. H7-2]|uniref:DUF4079 family protein n=1 Tax=Coleofasciculus sp. H7-2 TaxID=3351545 RepID=UPI00366E6815
MGLVSLSGVLERISHQFDKLGIAEPVVPWRHPLMMAIVIFRISTFVGLAEWCGRMVTDADVTKKSRADHDKLATWIFLLAAAGYTSGLLSLVMQQSILESLHFEMGSIVLVLLAVNGIIGVTGFGGNKAVLRTVCDPYLGSTALCMPFLHAVLGLKIGLTI